ncbi:MAG: lipoate--protein ligase family protein [Pirellulaceae bacterium]|nr:lipoate--protein ligase family protein [Pirellulaceae bacterium]
MACDDMLLASVSERGQWCLRFYQWSEPTLSLGYFQRLEARGQHRASRSCAVVRRATGGGAIVHDHELTYSFAASAGDRLSADLTALYDAFHETLIEALADFGLRAGLVPDGQGRTADQPFLCFQRRSRGDVVLESAKVAGSAQRRQHGAVLQHGSILLRSTERAPELPGIAELSGLELRPEQVIAAWTPRLACRLGRRLVPSEWTSQERQRAGEFAQQRYSNPAWSERR